MVLTKCETWAASFRIWTRVAVCICKITGPNKRVYPQIGSALRCLEDPAISSRSIGVILLKHKTNAASEYEIIPFCYGILYSSSCHPQHMRNRRKFISYYIKKAKKNYQIHWRKTNKNIRFRFVRSPRPLHPEGYQPTHTSEPDWQNWPKILLE